MNFNDDLLQKGVTEQRADYVTQGFLELLKAQVTLAAEDSAIVMRLFQTGKKQELDATLQMMGRRLVEAYSAYQKAFLLINKDKDHNNQIKAS